MIARSLQTLCAAFFVGVSTIATAEQWTIYKPGNTGIGGNLVEGFRLDPQGRPWVGARYPIHEDGGVSTFDGTKWTNYSTVDNLMPSEFVYSMAFSPDGTRWFGTDVGLVHHFGDHYTLFNSSNSPLPRNFIRSVQVDGSGRVWIVYWDPGYIFTGVARLDGSTWTIWPHNTSLGFGDAISLDKLVVAPNGYVWVGSNSTAGMARWNGTSWSRVVPGAGAGAPFNPYLGRDGRLWVLAGNDVRVLNGATWLSKPLPATDGLFWTALHAMPDGTYFVGNWQGQFAYNNGSGWQSMNTPAGVMAIESNSAGELWWVSLKRLYKFVSWGSWRVFHSGNTGLTEYFADSLSFDTAGRLWVGTSGGGACSFIGSVWRGYNPHNDGSEPWGLPTDHVDEIMGAKDGSVWIATGNSVARWNGSAWTQYGYGFMKSDVTEGLSGSIHATWDINTESGIGMFNGFDFARTNFMGAPLYGGEPRDLYVDSAGKVFFGTQTGLISNETGTWIRTDMATIVGPYGSAALRVTKAPNGDLWVGTINGAARRRAGAWTVFTDTNSGLPANTVNAISVRPDGLVAFGAFDGSTWPYHGGAGTFDGVDRQPERRHCASRVWRWQRPCARDAIGHTERDRWRVNDDRASEVERPRAFRRRGRRAFERVAARDRSRKRIGPRRLIHGDVSREDGQGGGRYDGHRLCDGRRNHAIGRDHAPAQQRGLLRTVAAAGHDVRGSEVRRVDDIPQHGLVDVDRRRGIPPRVEEPRRQQGVRHQPIASEPSAFGEAR